MKETLPINKMFFLIGDLYNRDSVENYNYFYLTKDKSLLYNTITSGDYSVLFGGNWRFELIVDSATGLCVKFQSFLDELKVSHRTIDLPESTPKKIFFTSNDVLSPGGGCHYFPFENKVYWDERKSILCIGNPNIEGEVVEFVPQTISVIRNGQIVCLYLILGNIADIDFL